MVAEFQERSEPVQLVEFKRVVPLAVRDRTGFKNPPLLFLLHPYQNSGEGIVLIHEGKTLDDGRRLVVVEKREEDGRQAWYPQIFQDVALRNLELLERELTEVFASPAVSADELSEAIMGFSS